MSVTVSPPTIGFNFSVVLTSPDLKQILMDGSPTGVTKEIPRDNNQGTNICNITVITWSGQPYTKPLILGGTDGSKFVLNNGGIAPCVMSIGPTSIPPAAYSVQVSG